MCLRCLSGEVIFITKIGDAAASFYIVEAVRFPEASKRTSESSETWKSNEGTQNVLNKFDAISRY